MKLSKTSNSNIRKGLRPMAGTIGPGPFVSMAVNLREVS